MLLLNNSESISMKIRIATLLFLLIIGLSLAACIGEEKPEGTMTVAELLQNPVYETEVRIYGEVRGIGELACTCFPLASGGETILVWYDTMVENGVMLRPPVNVEGIDKGDEIIVTGELKGEGGIHYSKGDFWAKVIVLSLR
jgi:hypothetical protein